MNLFVFGLGYSALHFVSRRADNFSRIAGTVRDPAKASRLRGNDPRLDAIPFGDRPAIEARLADADAILVSIGPDENDPALARYASAIETSRAKTIVYLSTIGVYGDQDGAWIDEETPVSPIFGRTQARASIEQQWLDLGAGNGKRVFILRLSGIYGPGRNAVENLRAGTARRIVKPGQVFNRIHVEDISRAISAAIKSGLPGGIFNITDDEPAPPQDIVAYAAALLGVSPPPEIPFENAELGPMAKSFWGQNKRVSNERMRETLGVTLAFPTYREGLSALAQQLR